MYKRKQVRLYTDESGKFKGEARVCYLKEESVELAIELLDNSTVEKNLIKVERAVFQKKEDKE